MKLAFQIIFIVVFLPFILFFLHLASKFFYYPDNYNDKLYIKIDDTNRPCFYVDSSYPIRRYGHTNLSISDESNNLIEENTTLAENYKYGENNKQIMWSFPKNSNYFENREIDFALSSFYGEENCISYGDNKTVKGLKEAKLLQDNIKYYAGISAEFDSETMAYFEVFFKLHKNQSTGKMEVEIVDN